MHNCQTSSTSRPPPIPPSAEERAASRLASECCDLVKEDRYAEALALAQSLVGTARASYVLRERLLANIALGRLDEARRILAAEVPPLGSAQDDYSDRSSGGLPPIRGIQGYLEAKAGRCPEPLWRFLTEEFYGQPQYTKLKASHSVEAFVTNVVPTDPSPRTLEFLMAFEVAPWLGPQAREALYRRAVELYPDSPVARIRLAEEMVGESGCLVEPDGTVADPHSLPVATPEQKAAFYTYMDSLRFVVLDEARAREILAHYRIARQHAPSDAHYCKSIADAIWGWEHRLGIRR